MSADILNIWDFRKPEQRKAAEQRLDHMMQCHLVELANVCFGLEDNPTRDQILNCDKDPVLVYQAILDNIEFELWKHIDEMSRLSDLGARLKKLTGSENFKAHIGGGVELAGVSINRNATDEEIIRAANLLKSHSMPTIGEQLKSARARIASAREDAAVAVTKSAAASDLVMQEVTKVLKEASDLRAEVAELTNGEPLE